MRIAVFGLGYVGSVTAMCLAADGHDVWGVDVDAVKIDLICKGIPPVSEPGLIEKLEAAQGSNKLRVTLESNEAVEQTDLALVCVGTPLNADGDVETAYVSNVCRQIGLSLRSLTEPYTVVVRSTLPPGATLGSVIPALEEASCRDWGESLRLYLNPEFLREGNAIEDFYDPPFIVAGVGGPGSGGVAVLRKIYAGVDAPFLELSYQDAELLKLGCNAFHALKVVFANEFGTLARRLGGDPTRIMDAFIQDTKLNVSGAYLRPGFAFGGSCLSKDVRALVRRAEVLEIESPLLGSILPSNDKHVERIASSLVASSHRVIGLVGLSFKQGTDDVRQSPALRLANLLSASGKEVCVYEPELDPGRLIGENLRHLSEMLPDYASRLVDWPTLRDKADVLVITRSGLMPPEGLDGNSAPIIDLNRLETIDSP